MEAITGIQLNCDKLRLEITGHRLGAKLAETMGLSAQTVNRKIKGERPITLDELNQIAQFTGEDALSYLLDKEL